LERGRRIETIRIVAKDEAILCKISGEKDAGWVMPFGLHNAYAMLFLRGKRDGSTSKRVNNINDDAYPESAG